MSETEGAVFDDYKGRGFEYVTTAALHDILLENYLIMRDQESRERFCDFRARFVLGLDGGME